jgi:SAM-dependent methyltransferase
VAQIRNKYVSRFLRSIGLAWVADYSRFQMMRVRNRKLNRIFKKQQPGIILPPDYTLYESFQMDYGKYFLGGKEDAEDLIEIVRPYCNLTTGCILDWGCGPARLLRHLPALLGNQNEYYGTDYNRSTIAWCKANFPTLHFALNSIYPPLSYPEDYFDLIYGISIFTHLSEENHTAWAIELQQCVKPKGIIYITTHGDAFLERLTSDEQATYRSGNIVSRTKVKEGHRMFAAFQPPNFMRNVFEKAGLEVIKHIPGIKVNVDYIQQDIWLLKRKI